MGALLQSDEPYGHLRIVSENGRRYDAEPSGFTMVQNRSVARHDLSLHALGLLVKLLRRRNGGTHLCCPSYEVLRKDCEHAGKMPSPRSIADWLRELAMARELAWVHTGRHSTYYFPGDAEFQSASDALVDSLTTTDTVVVSPITTATVEQHYQYGSDTTTATVVKQEVINKTNSTRHSAPTERAAPGPKAPAKSAVTTAKAPTRTVEAKPTGTKNVPPSKRANGKAPPPSGDGFGLVGWLLKEQGGISRPEWQKVADAKAADAVIARLGGVEKAREHATARLLEPRRATLLWAHILEDEQRAEAARQRGVMERHLPRQAVSAADGFGAVARKARGEENDDQGRDGRTSTTTFDGVARPL